MPKYNFYTNLISEIETLAMKYTVSRYTTYLPEERIQLPLTGNGDIPVEGNIHVIR